MPPLYGYPQPSGGKEESVFDHMGPAVYAQIVLGPPVTAGDIIFAREAGLNTFDHLASGFSDDGAYFVLVLHANNPGVPLAHVHAVWYTLFAGQVAGGFNLSAIRVRLRGIGNL
jgi:hypothetical protein